MMKLTKRAWLVISGFTWIGIGIMLLVKGLRFLVWVAEVPNQTAPILQWVTTFAKTKQQASLLLICGALLIGFVKGRTVLAKTVKRISARIQAGETHLTLNQVYDKKYYIILALMVGIGIGFRYFPIPLDLRGVVDVAIGSALINGAMLYFRHAVVPQSSQD